MAANGNFTYFTITAGGGAASGDYIMDAFQDISLPANNNTGYTSNSSVNPFGLFFNNDDNPKFRAKQLYIDDLKLIEDRSKWINNKPTYEVLFSEQFPGVVGYAYGNIRLRNSTVGKVIEVLNVDDGFGIGGIVRRCAFICQPTIATTGTADIVVDGVDTTNDVSFGGGPTSLNNSGYHKFFATTHASSNETKNIHDYRLTANETETLNIVGVIAYFENSGGNIDCFPGSTYVDKDKKTSSTGATLALPSVSGLLGARSLIYKSSAGSYTLDTVEPNALQTIGSNGGAGGTIDVTTGHGASFAAGMGVVSVSSGSSFYVGTVTSVSTDTLNVNPNTAFGVSGPLYRAWYAGPTVAISPTLYTKSFDFDPQMANVLSNSQGFGSSTTGDFYWQSQDFKYRFWGSSLVMADIYGYRAIWPKGFFKAEGYFSAAEIEFVGAGIIHGTFLINGTVSWGINEGFTGIAKKTVFTDAGPGWHQFSFHPGSSFGSAAISKVTLYENSKNTGISTGLLSQFDTLENFVNRSAINASLCAFGTYRRLFADSLYFSGDWSRGTTTTAAGGVFAAGSSTNSQCQVTFYGTSFAIIGTAGATLTVTLDGASINSSFNVVKAATLGFHRVVVTAQNGQTSLVEAFDYACPTSDLYNLQNYYPNPDLHPVSKTFEQWNTPGVHPNGAVTVWGGDPVNGEIWIWLFDRWNKLSVQAQSDDPRATNMYLLGGDE